MTDRLASLAEKDAEWRAAKKTVEAEVRQRVAERLAHLKSERGIEAYLARQDGHSIRKIAAALHTKATSAAYEAIADGEACLAPDEKAAYTEEFYTLSTSKPGEFVIAPPRADLAEFAAGTFNAGPQTSATYVYDEEKETVYPVDPFLDDDGHTNPVLRYVMQTKGYHARAYEWAKENVV